MTGRLLATAALLVIGLTTGCTGSEGGSDGPSPSKTPTATSGADLTAEVPQSEGLAKITVDGPKDSPISWKLPAGAESADPVGVTQRFLALYGQAGTPGTDPDVDLVSSVTDDAAPAGGGEGATTSLKILDGDVAGQTRSGHVWVWLDAAEESGDRAVVRGCADVGYFQPEGVQTPVKDRAEAWYTELRRVEDFDGKTVWKVSRHNAGPIRDSNEFEARCPGWARHTP